jgi:hypothetical protein
MANSLWIGLYGIAQWMFSFEYYNMMRIIPFVLDEIPPPLSILKHNRVQFWLWTVLNIVVALLLGIFAYYLIFF